MSSILEHKVSPIRQALTELTCSDLANLVESYFGGFAKIIVDAEKDKKIKQQYIRCVQDSMLDIINRRSVSLAKLIKSKVLVYFTIRSDSYYTQNSYDYFLNFLGLNKYEVEKSILVIPAGNFHPQMYSLPRRHELASCTVNDYIYNLTFGCFNIDQYHPRHEYSLCISSFQREDASTMFISEQGWSDFAFEVFFVAPKYIRNVLWGLASHVWKKTNSPDWKVPNKMNCLKYENNYAITNDFTNEISRD